MKKQYFRKANNIGFQGRGTLVPQPFSIGLLLGGATLVIFFLIRFFAPETFLTIVSPVLKTGMQLTAAAGAAANTDSKQALLATVDSLQSKNIELTNQNVLLTARVEELTRTLGTRTASEKGIIANVTARPPVSPYDILILDQGSTSGVAIDAFAYGPGGIPVGRISSVTEHTSRTTLFSSIGTQTAGWIGKNRVPVTIVGESAGAFSAVLPKEAGIEAGDALYVVSAGALSVGIVVSIENDPSSPNVMLRIRPYVNPFSLTVVTIEKIAR